MVLQARQSKGSVVYVDGEVTDDLYNNNKLLMTGYENASSAVQLISTQVTWIDPGVSSRPSLEFQDITPSSFRSFWYVSTASLEAVKL